MKKDGVEQKSKSLSKSELEQALIDNFVNLQKVLTNLAIKFDELSNNISKLLQLFEISAKTFAEKYSEATVNPEEVDKEFIKKLDSLLEQNKVISKGIMLMEERIRERNPSIQSPMQLQQGIQREDPRMFNQQPRKPMPRI
ncbi:MAG: hypothetical protein Q8N99_03455 [Nanoarchaeota archaeon]|nr:hypothetical protein [Nanoarchaeota archaeon]